MGAFLIHVETEKRDEIQILCVQELIGGLKDIADAIHAFCTKSGLKITRNHMENERF